MEIVDKTPQSVVPPEDPGTPLDEAISARGAWLRVDLDRLRANLDLVRGMVPAPTQIMAVVKADAYGHGLVEVAREAVAWGCGWLGAGNLAEGIALRRAGVTAPCLMLSPLLAGEALRCLEHGLTPSVADEPGAVALSRAVAAIRDRQGSPDPLAPPADLHVLVDVGLGRFGVPPRRLAQLGRAVADLPGLRMAGVYTHFADPADTGRTRRELELFLAAKDALVAATGASPLVHAAGSEAAVLVPETRLDLVRIGNLLYGYWAGPAGRLPQGREGQTPQPVLDLRARVIAVHDIPAGGHIGYGSFRTWRPVRIAVLPVGVADGVGLRAAQAGAGFGPAVLTAVKEVIRSAWRWRPYALVRGLHAPVIGRVGMQFVAVDVTSIPGVEVGEEASVPGVRATAARGLPRLYARSGEDRGPAAPAAAAGGPRPGHPPG